MCNVSKRNDGIQNPRRKRRRKKHVRRKQQTPMEECLQSFTQMLAGIDTDTVEAILAVLAGNFLPGDPLWLMIVGPPGSGKTELLRATYGVEFVFQLSSLTDKTLISGCLDSVDEEDPSLLPKLNGMTVVIKDYTLLLETKAESRKEIFSSFRDAYDGSSAKAFGTGENKQYDVKFNMLVAVTEAIESSATNNQELGERFLRLRLKLGCPLEGIRRSIDNANQESNLREKLSAAVVKLIESCGEYEPELPEELREMIVYLAEFLGVGRTVIAKDGSKNPICQPTPERGNRIAKQLIRLVQGVALLHGRDCIAEHDVGIAKRAVLDSLPWRRRNLLSLLCASGGASSSKVLAKESGLSISTVRSDLRDLAWLGVLEEKMHKKKTKSNATMVSSWQLTEDYREIVEYIFDGEE